MKTLDRAFRHLLNQGEPQPKQTAREEIGAAFAHRAIALTAWLSGDGARMESEMLLSAELFLVQGNLHETAVSRTLLGFSLAERSPALALACVEAGLDEMDDGFWLRPFAEVVKADCLLTLGERGKPRLRLHELRYGETFGAGNDLRLHWLAWRSSGRLGDPVAAVALASIGMCFLDDCQYEEAILCASDLIELAAMLPGDGVDWWLAGQLLEACEDRVALSGPFGTAMSALCWLHRGIEAGLPFSEAARPLLDLIPAAYRFHYDRLASLVPGC